MENIQAKYVCLYIVHDSSIPYDQALDFLAIGIHELANISERRIDRLTNPGKHERIPRLCDSLNLQLHVQHSTKLSCLKIILSYADRKRDSITVIIIIHDGYVFH